MTGKNNPTAKIAIAIITYNSAAKLPDLLTSLKSQDYPVELLDFIFVDNKSDDNGVALIKEYFPTARFILNQENLGFAAANNQAYELAKDLNDDYLVLLNDDTIVAADWLTRLITTAESEANIAAVQSKLLLWPEKNLINSYGNAVTFLGFAYCNDYRQPDKTGEPFEVPYPSGGATAIKISALDKIGLFDEKLFMYHEDVDLGWRLRLLGYKVILEPKAVVYHKYSFAKAGYKYYYMERNRFYVEWKNFKLATLLLFIPACLAMELGIIFFAWRNGWLREKLKGYGWFFSHLDYVWQERQKIQRLRRVSDREILRLFTGSIKFQDIDNPVLSKLVNPIMEAYFWLAKKIIFW
jgi:GT2 family glycosyltransferase